MVIGSSRTAKSFCFSFSKLLTEEIVRYLKNYINREWNASFDFNIDRICKY